MNRARRGQIKKVQSSLETAKCNLALVYDEEDTYLSNMVESIFNSEKGAVAQENISDLQYCMEGIMDIIDTLQEVIDRRHMS